MASLELDPASIAVFDSLSEGINIIDTDMRIVFGNKAYCRFLGKSLEEIKGVLLRELRPGALLPDVVSSGRPMMHVVREEEADIYFVNMYPIYINNEVAGGISVVTFVSDAYDFRAQIEAYEKRTKQLLRRISKANSTRYTFDSIVAQSEKAKSVKELAKRIAATDATVLLESESGTGKELYAQAIHNASMRKNDVFVAINCANFNSSLLESELFGYVEGAFTGAKKGGKIGLFEAASGGTLFLDEISEMDLSLQSKLLRVLQEKRIRPVGGVSDIEVDVRIICASNADLLEYVQKGKFRKDLYYRLSSVPIRIPPLRERLEDIPELTRIILDELSQKLKKPISISPEAIDCLRGYDWPGNVRELRNVLELSAFLSDNGIIVPGSLPDHLFSQKLAEKRGTLSEMVREFEKNEIRKLLQKNGHTLEGKKKTAKELGISLASLYNKLGGNI